jgi:hypothetical protein
MFVTRSFSITVAFSLVLICIQYPDLFRIVVTVYYFSSLHIHFAHTAAGDKSGEGRFMFSGLMRHERQNDGIVAQHVRRHDLQGSMNQEMTFYAKHFSFCSLSDVWRPEPSKPSF